MKSYCIREDYVARTEAATFVEDVAEYWNKQRIASAGRYQHYVYKKAAEVVALSQDRSFADVGCGYPRKTKELILPLTEDITLIDQPSMAGLLARDFPAMKFIPMNLEDENDLSSRKFDCVVSADVIEHLLDPDRLVAFAGRIVKPGGVIILSTPERDVLRGRGCLSSPNPEHVREWNSAEFMEYLEQSGLEVLEHCLLPLGRLSKLEELFLPLNRHLKIRRHTSSQMAVCSSRR